MATIDPSLVAQTVEQCRRAKSSQEWVEIITQCCGDDYELCAAVYSQLRASNDDATATMEPGGHQVQRMASGNGPSIGRLEGCEIGRFGVIKKIGEGGYGVVYLAEQLRPVRRHVALKVIRLGMATEEVVRRFEAERQAMALMDHTSVARIWDGGITPDGRPYVVMEYVEGERITRYCDRHRLSIAQRLELFLQVCGAIEHAHQRGVIHRDLKPSNVLVTTKNGMALPKVIDFGVAKALGTNLLSDNSAQTEAGQFLGTPLYMSPEQAQFSSIEVDVRSDVYSLGVILYELLVGVTPHSRRFLRDHGLDAMRRRIRDEDPPRASARYAHMKPVRQEVIADKRGEDARGLLQPLHRELDWIAAKALSRERERRYQSASDLAADVRRFLDGEPIEACPQSVAYRIRKTIARHAGVIVTAILLAAALLTATVVSVVSAYRAGEALARAEQDNRSARAAALRSKKLLYAGDMQLAALAAHRNDVALMRELLMRHIPGPGTPDLRGFEWYYLWNQIDFRPHEILHSAGPLYFACFSPNGQWLAAAGQEGEIYVLRAGSMTMRRTIDAGQGEVNGLAFSPDSRWLASAGDDGSVCLWDVGSGDLLRRFQTEFRLAFQVAFTPDGRLLATCGTDSSLGFWNVTTGKLAYTMKPHEGDIECVSISSGGLLFTGSSDESACLMQLATETVNGQTQYNPARASTVRRLLNSKEGDVTSVAFSHDHRVGVFGQREGLLTVYDVVDGGVIFRHRFANGVQSLAAAGGRADLQAALAVGDRGGSVYLVPIDWGQSAAGLVTSRGHSAHLTSWKAHEGRVYSAAFGPNGRQLVTAGEDGWLYVWDREARASGTTICDTPYKMACLDDSRIVTVAPGLPVLDARTGAELLRLSGDQPQWISVHVANGSQTIVAESLEGEFFGWQADGRPMGRLFTPKPMENVGKSIVSDDGAWMAIVVHRADGPSRLILQRLRPGGRSRVLARGSLSHVELSRTGRWLAYANLNTVHLVDTETGRVVREWPDQRAGIHGLDFSTDARYLAIIAGDRSLTIREVATGKAVWSVLAHENAATCVAFSPDGKTVATGGNDGLLRLWRWRVGRLVLEIPCNSWPIDDLAFSPDGHHIFAREDTCITRYDGVPQAATSRQPGHELPAAD